MNALGVSILGTLVVVVLFGSRRWAVLGIMAGVLYLTQAQAVNVFGFNMFAVRFLELAGFARVLALHELSFTKLNKIDRALLVAYTWVAVIYSLRSTEGKVYVIGVSVDAFLCYFTFRALLHDMEEFKWFLRSFALLLVPYAGLILTESLTHHSVFSFLGEGKYDWHREGRFRCVGSFRNPSLLGTLGAAFLPLYIGLGCLRAERMLACLGAGLCLVIVWGSNSGGPLCATMVGLIGWCVWFLRTRMEAVRWTMVGAVTVMGLLMKAPIWYVLARISDVTGGDGWHRAYLLDISFQNLGRWWLFGMPFSETSHWFAEGALVTTGAADITNLFISFGLTAGLGATMLLILLLARGFSMLGKAMDGVRSSYTKSNHNEFLLWGLGVVLVVHIANWLGITYFDQTYVIWFMQLAAVSTLSASCTDLIGAQTVKITRKAETDRMDKPVELIQKELAHHFAK